MDERLRLDYLDAMGIVQYAARFPLAGALPSPIVEHEDDTDDAEQTTTATTPQHIRQLLDEKTSTPTTAAKRNIKEPTPPTQPNASPSKTEQPVFHCHIALWKVDDLLVLAETPRTDKAQLVLLSNILKAIGRSEQLTNANQFSWPLPQHKDKTVSAARDHFQGMLDGGVLKNAAVRQILCFGNNISALLHSELEEKTTVTQYRDWPVTTACSLNAMLETPANKADTWRALQILVRT
ncbi:MAG: hypothetical protein R3E67_05935 [Pseudomonadales bacterium]